MGGRRGGVVSCGKHRKHLPVHCDSCHYIKMSRSYRVTAIYIYMQPGKARKFSSCQIVMHKFLSFLWSNKGSKMG